MSLWNPRKPLNQPPHFGRVATRDQIKRDDVSTGVKSAHQAAQFARYEKTSRVGMRAVVKE
jgi:hypothetical protein